MNRDHINKTLEVATKLKKVMQKKGLKRARAKCPDCPEKFIHGSINGSRGHLHMTCECGKYRFME